MFAGVTTIATPLTTSTGPSGTLLDRLSRAPCAAAGAVRALSVCVRSVETDRDCPEDGQDDERDAVCHRHRWPRTRRWRDTCLS